MVVVNICLICQDLLGIFYLVIVQIDIICYGLWDFNLIVLYIRFIGILIILVLIHQQAFQKMLILQLLKIFNGLLSLKVLVLLVNFHLIRIYC